MSEAGFPAVPAVCPCCWPPCVTPVTHPVCDLDTPSCQPCCAPSAACCPPCPAAGQAVWVLYLDLYILNAAGSLLDTALLAALTALQDTALPAVHLTEEGNVERDGSSESSQQQQQQQGVPLVLGCQPLSLTCGLYKGRLVADPDHEEEGLMGASVSVVVDQQQRLLGELGACVCGWRRVCPAGAQAVVSRRWCCLSPPCAGVYSVGQADQKQILSCAELANRRHTELMEQLQQQQQQHDGMES